VRGRYTNASPESLYQLADFKDIETASVDGINRVFTLDLPAVQSVTQAGRLALRKHRRFLYAGGTFGCEMKARAWMLEQDAIAHINFPPHKMVNKPFRVAQIETRVDGVVPIVFTSEDARIYDAEPDVVPPALIPTVPFNYLNNPFALGINESAIGAALAGSYSAGVSGNITQADNGAGAVTVTIPTHTRVYPTPYPSKTVTGGTLTFAYSEFANIYYDDPAFAGGAVTFGKTSIAADAYFSSANPYRHFVGYATAMDAAGAGGCTGGSSPPGGGGWQGGGGGGGQIP
jgi:hypothetical protein